MYDAVCKGISAPGPNHRSNCDESRHRSTHRVHEAFLVFSNEKNTEATTTTTPTPAKSTIEHYSTKES